MEQVIESIAAKLGISAENAKAAVAQVLGMIRGQVPAEQAAEFDNAVGAKAAELPADASGLPDLLAKSGMDLGQLKTIVEKVMEFVKSRVSPELLAKIDVASVLKHLGGGGGVTGLLGKLAGMFGGGAK